MNTEQAAAIHSPTVAIPLLLARFFFRAQGLQYPLARIGLAALAVRKQHDFRRDRFGLLLEFLRVLDKACRCALIADCLSEATRCRRTLAISGHARRKFV